MSTLRKAVLAAFAVGASFPAAAAITLLGTGQIAGDATDQSGLSNLLEDGKTPHNQIGGLGSGIAYNPKKKVYYATPDRGPADGTTTYIDRVYQLSITLKSNGVYGTNSYTVTPVVTNTTLLTNKAGEYFTGYSQEFDATGSSDSLRFDPEAIRVSCGNNVYVSDEYGPYVYGFNLNTGKRREVIALPHKFGIDALSGDASFELANNAFGRQTNRGMEGLAISPDGKRLFGLMQNALIQDGALNSSLARVATNSRLVQIDLQSGEIKEFYYPLENAANGLNEIVAVNDHQFLVIERDGKVGAAAAFKKLYKIDIAGATDIRNVKSLPATGVPSEVTPVAKSLFLDLLAPEFGLAGASFPEKIEGLAFGPVVEGRQTLVVTSDNDFVTANSSKFYVFGIDAADLPGFQQQTVGACNAAAE